MTGGTPQPIILATRNAGKLAELQAIAREHRLAVEDLTAVGLGQARADEDALECFSTFEANARAKARWFAAQLPGRMVIADDSGLEVFALGGLPGVRSKRWAESTAEGETLSAENNAALLRALAGAGNRAARFVTVVVAVCGTAEWVAIGACGGRILEAPDGLGGFGYDPLFWSDDLRASFASVSRDEKARVSHRGRAFRALLAALMAGGTQQFVEL